MANQELIFKIAHAVYDRLGAETAEQVVEQLVLDIYNVIDPHLAAPGAAPVGPANTQTATTGAQHRLIVSVFGIDHPGIVAGVTQILAEVGCSIIDINQTVVQGKFAMVIIADMSRSRDSAAVLKERFALEGQRLGVHIYAQREDLFNAMHRI
jgi:ACT domain-containing protein